MSKDKLIQLQQTFWHKLSSFEGAYEIPKKEIRNGDILITMNETSTDKFIVSIAFEDYLLGLDGKNIFNNGTTYDKAIKIGHEDEWRKAEPNSFLRKRVSKALSLTYKSILETIYYPEDILLEDVILTVGEKSLVELRIINNISNLEKYLVDLSSNVGDPSGAKALTFRLRLIG